MGEARVFPKEGRQLLAPTVSCVTQSLTFDSGTYVGWCSQMNTDMEENESCRVLRDRVEDKW